MKEREAKREWLNKKIEEKKKIDAFKKQQANALEEDKEKIN